MLIAAPTANAFMLGMVAYHIPLESYRIGAEDLDRIAEAGAEWIAVDFAWREVEWDRGIFDFSYYDSLVSEAGKRGIGIFARIGNGYNGARSTVPQWTEGLGREEYDLCIRNYASAVSSRYASEIDYYAIENEPNNMLLHVLSGWRTALLPERETLSTMNSIVRGVREGDEGATIALSIALSPGYLEWIEHAEESVDFDMIALNGYKSPAVLAREIEKLRAEGYRVVLLETGLSTLQRSEEEQAEFVSSVIIAAYNAGAEGVFIYQYRDNEEEPNAKERFFGLVRPDGTGKLALTEYSAARDAIEKGGSGYVYRETMRDAMSTALLESTVFPVLMDEYLRIVATILVRSQYLHELYLKLMDVGCVSRLANPLRL
jgi:hypothetical protein